MPDYRRYYIPGGSYFFTLVTHERARFLTTQRARSVLGDVMRECRERWSYQTDAVVLLEDHLHAMWSLERGDERYSMRWAWIKKEFTKRWLAAGGAEGIVSNSRRERRGRGVWQRRFWEHALRDETDFERHLDYIHYNPVKHGLVECPADWPYSSFQRWVALGTYDPHWGCASRGRLTFTDIDKTAME